MAMIVPAPAASGVRAQGLKAGARAPEFDLPSTPDGRRLSLAHVKGAPVVLVFYPADFTPVCSGELALFNELQPEFSEFDAHVLGISVDSVWAHIAFAKEVGLRIPLLADFHPKGDVARRYDVFREEDGFCERALYLIDPEGTVAWSHVSPPEVNPGADGVLEALERLTGKALGDQTHPHAQARAEASS
jgi:peroxiredoxin